MTEATKPKSSWLNLVVDYGPILAFFIGYKVYSPESDNDAAGELFAIMRGTAAFMIAAVVALIASRTLFGRVSPLLWVTTCLIVVFGGMTLWSQDDGWIRRKPTLVYMIFAVVLIWGWRRGKPLLRTLLDAAFEGLNHEGWMKLSRNWGFFFIILAFLNEGLNLKGEHGWLISTPSWYGLKLWVFLPLTFLFTFVQIPMLLRHGMAEPETKKVLSDPPHE
jgi:intracellular septation protein